MSDRATVKNILRATFALLILCIIGAGSYLALQRLPAFYQAPSTNRKLEWNNLPQPVIVNNDWQTWSSTNQTNDAIWTDQLIWLGTDGGVAVFDQISGESVKFLPQNGLPAVTVSTITSDREGRIWVGTLDSGVAMYDGSSWEQFGDNDGLPSAEIRDLYAAPDGVIWAATRLGPARYDGDRWSTVRFSLLDLSRIEATQITGWGNTVWIGSKQGVYYFNGDQWSYFGLNEGVINETINAVTITPDRRVWVATPSGISRFDGSSWDRFTVLDGLPDLPAVDILAAPDSSVWITFAHSDNRTETTTIQFDLIEAGHVELRIYNSAGQLVRLTDLGAGSPTIDYTRRIEATPDTTETTNDEGETKTTTETNPLTVRATAVSGDGGVYVVGETSAGVDGQTNTEDDITVEGT